MANEKVLVSKKLLNNLANKFKTLTGKNKTFTIQEMIEENVGIQGVSQHGDDIVLSNAGKFTNINAYDVANQKINIYGSYVIETKENGKIMASYLSPEYIKKDITILGVTGTLEEGISGVYQNENKLEIKGESTFDEVVLLENKDFVKYDSNGYSIIDLNSENTQTKIYCDNMKTINYGDNFELESFGYNVKIIDNKNAELHLGFNGNYGSVKLSRDDIAGYFTADNLEPQYIKKGVNILGYVGEYEGNIKGVSQQDGYLIVNNDNENTNIDIYGDRNLRIFNGTTNVAVSQNGVVTANNLVAENIKQGVNILGVIGNLTSSGGSSENTLKKLLDARNSAQYLFYSYENDDLNELIQYNDTENISSIMYMFQYCQSTTFPLINTSKCSYFSYAYSGCANATYIPLLDTAQKNGGFVIMIRTFEGCNKIKKLEITYFTQGSTANTNSMCNNCYSLKAFIIRNVDRTACVLSGSAFQNCYWLNGTTNETYNPNGEQGYIYAPRDTIETLSSATNWSTLQFRALEDYTVDGTTTGEFDDEKAGI